MSKLFFVRSLVHSNGDLLVLRAAVTLSAATAGQGTARRPGGEHQREVGGLDQEIDGLVHQVTARSRIQPQCAEGLKRHAGFVIAGGHEASLLFNDMEHLSHEFHPAKRNLQRPCGSLSTFLFLNVRHRFLSCASKNTVSRISCLISEGAQLGLEVPCPTGKVKVLDIDDYDAVVGTVLLRGEPGVPAIQVSSGTQQRVDEWLTVRGCAAGLLFGLPDLSAYEEQSCSGLPDLLEAAPDENQAAADYLPLLNELIELCCEGQSQNVCRYLLWTLMDWGDWPTQVLETIRKIGAISISEGLYKHGLSKKQVHRCREKLARRLERMGVL